MTQLYVLSRRSSFLGSIGLLVVMGFTVLEVFAQSDLPDKAWIYRKRVLQGAQPNQTPVQPVVNPETYFSPFFLFPASGTDRIRVSATKPIARLDPNAEEGDTCVEFVFGLTGGTDFLGAGFIPGDTLGSQPAFDLTTRHLAVGFGRQVHLKFRARTTDRETLRVRFESCGVSIGNEEDGIRLPQTPIPKVTLLNDKWSDISIDLSKKATGLSSLVCPLKVIARSEDNPGREEVTVYLDDLRFEVTVPVRKGN